jgi:hypothetical protein
VECLSNRNGDILYRMMIVNLEIPFAMDLEIEQTMASEKHQHVIQEWYTGRDAGKTCSIE